MRKEGVMLRDRKLWLLAGIEIAFLCLWGGLYDFAAALYGVAFSVFLMFIIRKNKYFILPCGITSISIGIILAGYVISVFTAMDKGIALIGVIRFSAVCLFWILWNNLNDSTRTRIKTLLPMAAFCLTAAAMVMYMFPYARECLFNNDRLGGIFQYSNTYAVFLLVAIILIAFRERKNRKEYVELTVLLVGIVLTGSRSVFVLLILTVIILLAIRKVNCLKIFAAAVTAVGVCLFLQRLSGFDIGRLLKLTLNSSTLNGRFLYWYDAIQVIIKNPLGLGYMGYFFFQPQFQTGNYITKFVHNDILQCGLDAGVIPMVALVVVIFANIFNRKNSGQNRLALLIIFLHCMFDFDLQFTAMFCIMLMFLREESRNIRITGWGAGILTAGMALVCGYFSLALFFSHFEMNSEALALYPADTFAREKLMREKGDEGQARIIIRENGMLASAYECSVQYYLKEQEYVKACEDVRGILKCAGYDISLYNQSVYYLSIALDQAVRKGDMENAGMILDQILAVPDLLEELRAKTSFFAYRIYDVPQFELDESIEEYIRSLSDISLMQ